MKKILLSVASFFALTSSAYALDCSYLNDKKTAFEPNDLPCLTQELVPVMKEMLKLPVKVDEMTTLFDVYETKKGKEITFFYSLDSRVQLNEKETQETKKELTKFITKSNCENPKFVEMFNIGGEFNYSYSQLNKVLFEIPFNRDSCKTYFKNKTNNVKTDEVKTNVVKTDVVNSSK